eukprot:5408003-Pleurochrysis_carterae.AAC.4
MDSQFWEVFKDVRLAITAPYSTASRVECTDVCRSSSLALPLTCECTRKLVASSSAARKDVALPSRMMAASAWP